MYQRICRSPSDAADGFASILSALVLSLICSQFAIADELAPNGDAWTLGGAAIQLKRLPPTDEQTSRSLESVATRSVSRSSTQNSETIQPSNDGLATRLYIGYDHGFVTAADQATSGDAGSLDFLIRVNSWLQLRQTVFDSDGPNADQNTFSFERLRLSFGGHVMSPDLEYFFQFDGNSDRSTETIFLDYFVTYDVGRNLFGFESERLGIKLGKWKVPFSRSRAESGRLLQFTDRATANVLFDLNRSFGIGLTSQIDALTDIGVGVSPIWIETAIFNGFRTGSVSTIRGEGLDRNFGWSMRGYVDLFGDFGPGGEADLSWHCEPVLRVGGGLAFTRVDREGSAEFDRQRVVDSGVTLSSLLPASITAYDVWLSTVDAQFKYRGLSVIAEYYWRNMTQFNGAGVPGLADAGYVLQAGQFLVAEKLELIARWSRITGDSGTLGGSIQSSDEIGAGAVWYIKGDNAKVTFDVTHVNGAPVNSARLDLLPGDAGWLFRTQCQIAF